MQFFIKYLSKGRIWKIQRIIIFIILIILNTALYIIYIYIKFGYIYIS